ncbi:S8 family serine peptidase, partial [Streptomyces niveiscabiei]|uniref:S8 family serine peptidase n=1 Tax=Streptomyces niveiscabiei TaxID=164115 RepID=UPI0038F7E971
IGAKAAWDRGILGAGVEIAVVDSGVHLTHQDLVKNLRPGANFVDPSKPPQDDECSNDDCGHGTHVAGIAAASIDDGGSVGVAPRAGIVPL